MADDIKDDPPVEAGIVKVAELPRAVMGINQTIFHRPVKGQAVEVVSRSMGSFTRVLENDEQPWIRKMTVGEAWVPVSLGWANEGGKPIAQLSITNEEGSFTQAIPSKEQMSEALDKVIIIGQLNPYPEEGERVVAFAKVKPQESGRFEPCHSENLRVRCMSGEAKIIVAAVQGDSNGY